MELFLSPELRREDFPMPCYLPPGEEMKETKLVKSPVLSTSDTGREKSVGLLPTVFSYHHPPRTCVEGCRRRHSDIRRTSGTL